MYSRELSHTSWEPKWQTVPNAPLATWGDTHVFPTNHDPLYTKTLSFWFAAPPLVRVLKRKLGPGRGPMQLLGWGGGTPTSVAPSPATTVTGSYRGAYPPPRSQARHIIFQAPHYSLCGCAPWSPLPADPIPHPRGGGRKGDVPRASEVRPPIRKPWLPYQQAVQAIGVPPRLGRGPPRTTVDQPRLPYQLAAMRVPPQA